MVGQNALLSPSSLVLETRVLRIEQQLLVVGSEVDCDRQTLIGVNAYKRKLAGEVGGEV